MPGQPRLTRAERRQLERLVESPDQVPEVVARARLVLEVDDSTSGVGIPLKPASRKSGAKWRSRFREAGAAGLLDAPRGGRPLKTDAESLHHVLTAPLFADSPAWTSRSIASTTSLSQSRVIRLWSKAFEPPTPLPAELASESRPLALSGYFIDATGSVLLLSRTSESSSTQTPAEFMRTARRRQLQTVLAADLLNTTPLEHTGFAGHEDTEKLLARFVEDAFVRSGDQEAPRFALCSTNRTALRIRKIAAPLSTWSIGEDRWQGLLGSLGPRLSSGRPEDLAVAQKRVMEWARNPGGPGLWLADVAPTRSSQPTRRGADSSPMTASQVVANALASRIEREVVLGRLRGGDAVPETSMARAINTTRSQTREAVRILAADGLLVMADSRTAVVPLPVSDDVLETYAARRSLGALIVRRVAESPEPGHLALLQDALERMIAASETGDAWMTGDEDLRFQDVMASMSGMKRVPTMFNKLTTQLRLFVAVLGVRYAYSVPDMCRDNLELFRAISAGQATDATRVWDRKMRDAAQYMLNRLDPPRPGP